MQPTNWDDGTSRWDVPGNYFDRGPPIPFVQVPAGDIKTVWNISYGTGDWVLVGTQLDAGDDLQTAVLISLFSDRTAEPGDVIPDGTNDPRGWVGDLGEDYPIGSRLWLLDRSKQTPGVLQDAVDYCNEALQWMIDDGVVAAVNVTASWIGQGGLGIQVQLLRKEGSKVAMKFANDWKGVS